MGYLALNLNTTGTDNTAMGSGALDANTTAPNNTAIGSGALTANTTATGNVAVGHAAGFANTTGANNTFIGKSAGIGITTGSDNTFLGKNAASTSTTGSSNVIVGSSSSTVSAGSSNAQGFGYNLTCSDNYTTIGQGAADIRAEHGVATWATVSDERYKKDIVDSTAGLSFINALQPRTFNYRTLGELPETFRAYEEGSTEVYKNSNTNHGFIAQEIKAAIDADDSIKDGFRLWDDRDDGSQEVAEAALIPVLVKAIQELSAEVETLKSQIGE